MSKKKNIWIFTKWHPHRNDPQFGVFITKHAEVIAEHFNVFLLFVHPLKTIGEKTEIEIHQNNSLKEIIVYYKKRFGFRGKLLSAFAYLRAFSKGLSVLKLHSGRPDLILSYIMLRTAVAAWYISRRMKIPFVIAEQWSGYATGRYSKKSFFIKRLSSFIVSKASAVVSVSSFLKSRMQSSGLINKNYEVIPNVIEQVKVSPICESGNTINVLLVADLVDEIKNISSVIRMTGNINRSDFSLRIIGHGTDELKLKALAKAYKLLDTRIFFEGIKSNKEVYSFLQQCDFLIMNSNFETFSLICAEAMSCGKPVLATRCGGPEEFVTPQTGILTEPGNDIELEKNFVKMLDDFKNYDPLIIRQHAEKLFSRKSAGEKFKILFERIINSESDST